MADLTLAHELALLAYDDEGVDRVGTPNLGYGLAGAVLLDLTLAGRIEVADDRVVVVDPSPLGQPTLDAALTRIGAEAKRRRPKDWITRLSGDLRGPVLDELVEAGVLRREAGRVLGLFPRTRFPSTTGVEPAAEASARQRMHLAVATDGPVPARTAALVSLTRAVGLDRKLFRDLPKDQVKRRLKEIGEGSWASAATRRAVEETQAALIAATATAAVISTTTAS
ncbi:GPP34 family phosphoprotein [Micromonospora sp. NPDC023956]|uniref:GOLPH3/VPS74 family protein n=1 Tax=Micromonospora sp. NPDC023956 TaxID=3155722 RepID=UPI0033C7F543